MNRFQLLVVNWLASTCLLSLPLAADDWSRFRGPNGSGIVARSNYPIPWTTNDVLWEIDLPGTGNGSPVIADQRIYLQAANVDTGRRWSVCYDLQSGAEKWRAPVTFEEHPIHQWSSYASSTPCVDGSHVFVAWGTPDQCSLTAYTLDGDFVWSRDFGGFISQHGFGTSPITHDGVVLLFVSQDAEDLPPGVLPGKSFLVAVDAATGKTLWSHPQTSTRVSYGVPCLIDTESGPGLVISCSTEDGFQGIDIQTGNVQWQRPEFGKRVCSSLVAGPNFVLGTEGSGGGGNRLIAIRNDGSGEVLFEMKKAAPYVPTPIVQNGRIFCWSDKGIVSCLTPTGQIEKQIRIGGNVSSSPIIVNEKLIGIADDGTLTILAADDTLEQLGQWELNDSCRATPAANEDFLVIRTDTKLICISNR